MDYIKNMAVQSYCFMHFQDNRVVVEKMKELGLNRIEICGRHANFDDPATWDTTLAPYQEAGIKVVSIGVQHFHQDEKAARKRFEFAKLAGSTTISAVFPLEDTPRSFRIAEKLADEFDINLAIHNHGPKDWQGCCETLRYIFKNTSPRIGLMLETAWAQANTEDPIAMALEFKDRLYGAHLKDFKFHENGLPYDVVIGKGGLDLPKFFKTLDEVGFDGNLILEYEGDPTHPIPALKDCIIEARNAVASA